MKVQSVNDILNIISCHNKSHHSINSITVICYCITSGNLMLCYVL